MTTEEKDKIKTRIAESALSEDAKFFLEQFLQPIACGCGHTLVHDDALTVLGTHKQKVSRRRTQ